MPKTHLYFILLILTGNAYSQLGGYNLSELQRGNIPGILPNDRHTLYNQLNLQYRENNLKIKVQVENFMSSDSIKKDYYQLSKLHIDYKVDDFKFSVGNMYESLGRGILLRCYEVNASVYEDIIYRIKQGFYRDIFGISTAYSGKNLQLKFISGKVLNNLFPPGYEERRQDFVNAFSASYTLFNQQLTGNLMRLDALNNHRNFSSIALEGQLPSQIYYYAEYASPINEASGPLGRTEIFYVSLSKSFNRAGISAEYKDYKNAIIGSGISDPPTLVKEQSYKLLNRSTHVSNLLDENGFQVEMYYTFSNNSMLTLNTARAVNGFFVKSIFNEYFGEYSFYIGDNNQIKTFADWSKDDFLNERNRYSGGAYLSSYLGNGLSSVFEFQYQYINRYFSADLQHEIDNMYASISMSRLSKISLALLYEFTNDPFISDNAQTSELETEKHYPGAAFTYKTNKMNITLFGGSRRGGPACTSGICYEVLDFTGLELRTIIKF